MAFCTGPIPVRVALYVKWPFVQARFQCVLHYTLYGLLYRPDSSANCTKKLFHTWNAIPKSAIWWHHSCSRICFQQIRNAIPTWDAHISPAWPAVLSKPCLHENSKGFLQFTIAIMHVHNWHEHILFQIAQNQQFHKKNYVSQGASMRDGTAKKILTLTVHWHSCCQMPVAKQTSMEKTVIHVSTRIDLHSSMGQLTSETRTCTQLLPDASCKTNFNGNKTVIQLSTRIDLHSSTLSSQLTSETRTGTQLPVAMQLQNKLQWKHLSSMYLLALICIHPIYLSTDIWNSNVHTAASCSCKTNFNGKNCHPESRIQLSTHWFAFIHFF